MDKIFNKWYPYHVWLTSMVIGPAIWMIIISIKAGGMEPITDIVVMLFISFLIGAILSLPILLFYVLAYRILQGRNVEVKRLKLILS